MKSKASLRLSVVAVPPKKSMAMASTPTPAKRSARSWKKGFDAGKGNRDKAGVTARYVLRDVDKPNFVTVVLESGSLENAKKFVSEIKERIRNSAVIVGAPDIKIGTTGAVDAKK
jgi:hypothetical protein